MHKLLMLALFLPLLDCGGDLAISDVDEALPIRGGGGGDGDPPPTRPPVQPKIYCWRDADGDGQGGGATGTYFTGKVCPSGWTTVVGDCNDGDANTWSRWCRRDLDGDGHAGTGTVQMCVSACPHEDLP